MTRCSVGITTDADVEARRQLAGTVALFEVATSQRAMTGTPRMGAGSGQPSFPRQRANRVRASDIPARHPWRASDTRGYHSRRR